MKKFLIWILATIAIVVTLDVIFGAVVRHYINKYPLRGDYRSTDHLLKDSVDDLVVIGSSVALNSINTKTISDSLGIKAYNGGSNGQSFPFYLSMIEALASKPGLRTVILGMNEDVLTSDGLGRRYNFLIPYYHAGYENIDRRLESMSPLNPILFKSSLYRFNTIWFRILLYHFIEPGLQGDCGFIAKDIPPFFPTKSQSTDNQEPVTENRVAEFERFIELCRDNGIRLIVCIPPRYQEQSDINPAEEYLRRRASDGDFTLWYDAHDTPLSADSTLFYDNIHLNYRGAEIYTQSIIERLRAQSTQSK